ncbi:MAG: ATPase domain-containing protein [Spirochaetota bacterium]
MVTTSVERYSTGVDGLDTILGGGYPAGRIYLVHGPAGAGKTTLGLQFLMAGAAAGRRCMGITLLQTLSELRDIIASHDWHLDGITLTELPPEIRDAATRGQTVFNTGDVELSEVADAIEATIREHQPECLFIDSLSELGILVNTEYQLRRQLLRLKQLLDTMRCTTVLSAGYSGEIADGTLETLVHGVVGLEMRSPEFGRVRRRVLVSKMRGMDFPAGYHDADILTGGLQVYPRVMAGVTPSGPREGISSGNEGIDALLGGGLEAGTTCVISGTSGAGKSSVTALYSYAAALRGVPSSIYCFDERIPTLLTRMRALGMPIDDHVATGLVKLRQIDVGAVSPGRLSQMIRTDVEEHGAQIITLDSLSGYLQSMPGERELITQLHELLGYLSGAGVLSLMVIATHGLFGEVEAPVDVSYIADTVILLRHFESRGEVRRCVAVLKKRFGAHERTIRELQLGADGIAVGQPLSEFTGLLTGLPRYEGHPGQLLDDAASGDE